MCYKTGQFYLLLTAIISHLDEMLLADREGELAVSSPDTTGGAGGVVQSVFDEVTRPGNLEDRFPVHDTRP